VSKTLDFDVFDAFRKAGTPEPEARKAAEQLAQDSGSLRGDIAAIRIDIAVIKDRLTTDRWIFGFFFAVQLATLAAVFFHR